MNILAGNKGTKRIFGHVEWGRTGSSIGTRWFISYAELLARPEARQRSSGVLCTAVFAQAPPAVSGEDFQGIEKR